MGDNTAVHDDMAPAAKVETPAPEATPSSIESSPEPDAVGPDPGQEPAQPQKRKGGRKPIYATSEERKQRNRQAQAAFRERRTEYIKQLEATIKQNEDSLASLQQSHRSAADECLMLRYKNSLLERILLEKGVDVQAELQMKTGSPVLGAGFLQHIPGIPQQPPLQRTAIQRQQARRSAGHNFLPKLAPGQSNTEMNFATISPLAHPTPSSHASSPSQLSTRSPLIMHQGGITPPTSAVVTQPPTQPFQNISRSSQQHPNHTIYEVPQPTSNAQRPAQRSRPPSNYQNNASPMSGLASSSHAGLGQAMTASSGAVVTQPASSFYPSPFQKHFDQLDQEYDTQHSRSMLDDPDPDDLAAHQFDQTHAQQQGDFYQQSGQQMPQMTPQSQYGPSQMMAAAGQPNVPDGHFDEVDPNDIDADPFGLSASMHYPTNYSFDQQHGQR